MVKKIILSFLLLISVTNAKEEQNKEVNMQEIKNEIPFDKRVSVYFLALVFRLVKIKSKKSAITSHLKHQSNPKK